VAGIGGRYLYFIFLLGEILLVLAPRGAYFHKNTVEGHLSASIFEIVSLVFIMVMGPGQMEPG
jgi:hypothetical protein